MDTPDATPDLSVRPLVIGANGLVGKRLTARLEEVFPHTVSATRTELDITDRWRTEAEIERLEPTVVINCAAMSDVDACERDPEAARRQNADGPAHLAYACRNAGVRLVHISTDYVFDGEKGAEYAESDAPNPVNEYGRSKLLGELAVTEALADALILRVSFVFGPGRPTFIDTIARKALGSNDPIPVLDDWRNRPTHVDEIVHGIEQALTSDASGTFHLAGGGPPVTRFEFARGVVALLGYDPERVQRLDPAALTLPARRPHATPLSTRLWAERFAAPRPWTERAREYLDEAFGEPAR